MIQFRYIYIIYTYIYILPTVYANMIKTCTSIPLGRKFQLLSARVLCTAKHQRRGVRLQLPKLHRLGGREQGTLGGWARGCSFGSSTSQRVYIYIYIYTVYKKKQSFNRTNFMELELGLTVNLNLWSYCYNLLHIYGFRNN